MPPPRKHRSAPRHLAIGAAAVDRSSACRCPPRPAARAPGRDVPSFTSGPAILRLFVLAILLVLAAYASAFLPGGAPAWAAWAMAVGTTVAMLALIALGASRGGRAPRPLLVALLLVALLVLGAFAAALLLPPEGTGTPLLLGLPRRAAIVIWGAGLLPMFVLPVVYALTFDRLTLAPEDLERVRRDAVAARGQPDAREAP